MLALTTGRCLSACPDRGALDFDTAAAAQNDLDRRIGRNELSAIRTLLACVNAQQDYFIA